MAGRADENTNAVLREFLLDYETDHAGQSYRHQDFARLVVHRHYRDDDPNKWTCETGNEAVGFNWSSREQKARDRFNKEVRALCAKERVVKADGLFAEGRYTLGSNIADAEEPRLY